MESFNLTDILAAQRDRYASRQGEFVLAGNIVQLDSAAMVWEFMRSNPNHTMRIVYVCKNGRVRDIIGRQGVYQSQQDGELSGTGHAMANAETLTLSFHTHVFEGKAVNTGAGKGYRTLRAAGIVAIRVDGTDILTGNGKRLIQACLNQGHPPAIAGIH